MLEIFCIFKRGVYMIAKYSGLIVCRKCGKNFKSKVERGVQKYICAGYDRYGKEYCERERIKEDYLDELIELHFKEKLNNSTLRNCVRIIEIFENNKWVITYTDGSQTIRARNFLQI
jgi:hypothetical protein